MAITETQTTISQETSNQKQDIMSQIKGFFSKFKNKGGENAPKTKTRAFKLTAKDATVALILSLVIVAGAGIYGRDTMNKYNELNNRSDELRELSTYNNISLSNAVDPYSEGNSKSTIIGALEIDNNIMETLANRKEFKKEQKNYYEILLQNIYLPSLNVWKNPYTENFDESVMGQKYLETDKFQDLYLITQRSDFVKYVGNDAEYNNIRNVKLGEMVEIGDTNHFYIPVSIIFSSPNKRSFLLLVNKLSMTSNVNNISLLNEFFFYLLLNIKERKGEAIEELMQKYWSEFSSSSTWDGPSNISDLTNEERSTYMDKVIGYELYNWINDDEEEEDINPLIDDDIIVETIKENTMCDSTMSDTECFYNFREKYRDLPYLAYKIGMEKQINRTEGFREFLKDLPSIIAITDFGFNKYSNSSFLNNEEERYEGILNFNAYGRGISIDELNEAASKLGDLCFGAGENQQIFPDTALEVVNNAITSLGGLDNNVNINYLQELKGIFEQLSADYPGLTNYKKMIRIFESWRMLNDANLCNK